MSAKDNYHNNKAATALEDLKLYGLNRLETVLEREEADGHLLVLKSDYATLRFTSF